MIRQIIQTVLFEIKVCLNNWNIWLLALLVNAYTWTAFVLAGQVMSGAAQMFFPVLIFLAVVAVTRNKKEDFTEIMYTLPYNNLCLLVGQALAIFSLFLLLGIELLLTMLLVSYTALPVYISWSACWAFMVKYIIVCINVIGITFLVASLTRSAVRLYSILLFLWLVGAFVASNTGLLFPPWVAMLNFTYIHGFGGNPSEITGLFPHDTWVAAIVFFQVTSSLVLFIIAVSIESVKRGPQQDLVKQCAVQTLPWIAVIAVISTILWGNIEGDRVGNKVLPPREDSVVSAIAVSSQKRVVLPTRYNLYIKLDTKSHQLAGKAQITLTSPANVLPPAIEFTLRDYLYVNKVVDTTTGQALEWRQQGAYLTVLPPKSFAAASLITVEISYSGVVWEWSNDFSGQPAGLVNFVADPVTCLRGGHAWYPVVGRQSLYSTTSYSLPFATKPKELVQPLLILHDPVPFEMTVDSRDAVTFISNLELVETYNVDSIKRHKFFSQACRGVVLLSGPYAHTPIVVSGVGDVVDLYHFPAHSGNLSDITKKQAQIIDYYDSLVPREKNTSLFGERKRNYVMFEAPRFLVYDNLMRANNLGLLSIVPVTEAISVTKALQSPWWSQAASRTLSEARLLNLWWPNCFSQAYGNIADGLALYMYTLHKEHKYGKKSYDNAREYWQSYADDSPDNEEMLGRRGQVVQEVFLLLDTIRGSNLGDDGVKQFLRIIYARYQNTAEISVNDIVDALKQIGAFANENAPKEGSLMEVKYRERINKLTHVLENPTKNRFCGTFVLKLNWDFGAEVKVLKVK